MTQLTDKDKNVLACMLSFLKGGVSDEEFKEMAVVVDKILNPKAAEPCIQTASKYLNYLLAIKKIPQIVLAEDTGLTAKTINDICKGRKNKLSANVAVRLARVFTETTAGQWLAMDNTQQLDLAKAKLDKELKLKQKEAGLLS